MCLDYHNYSNLRNKRRGTAILSSAIFHPLLTYLRPLRLFFLKLFTKNPFFMSTSGRILADFHPIRTYFGFFNPLRLFIFENEAASTFIRPSTFIPEVRVCSFGLCWKGSCRSSEKSKGKYQSIGILRNEQSADVTL